MALNYLTSQFLSVSVTDGTAETIADGLGVGARLSDVSFTERVKTYGSTTELQTDLTASEIDQDTYDAGAEYFSQSPRARTFMVIRWDVDGPETAAEALSAAETAGFAPPWQYALLTMDSRTAADHVSASNWCETRDVLLFVQTSSADAITTGVPAAYSGIVDNAKTILLYEDTDAKENDSGWMGRLAAHTPEDFKMASTPVIAGLLEYASILDTTAVNALKANHINGHMVTVPGGSRRNIFPGETLTGRTVALAYTLLLTRIRLIQSIGEMVSARFTAGLPVPQGPVGEELIGSKIDAKMFALLGAGYIAPDTTNNWPNGFIRSVDASTSSATASVSANYNGEVFDLTVSVIYT